MIEPIVGRNSCDAAPRTVGGDLLGNLLLGNLLLGNLWMEPNAPGPPTLPGCGAEFFRRTAFRFRRWLRGVCLRRRILARIGGAASGFRVIHADSARRNEQIGDGDPCGVGDPLDGVDFDVAGAALDSGDRWSRNLGFLGELVWRVGQVRAGL